MKKFFSVLVALVILGTATFLAFGPTASPTRAATVVVSTPVPAQVATPLVVTAPTKNPYADIVYVSGQITTTVPANEFPEYTPMDSDDVKTLQTALRNAGYSISVDGVFGPRTGETVFKYQTDKGLSIDGIAGKGTASSLGISYKNSKNLCYVVDLENEAKNASGDWILYVSRHSKVDGKVKPTLSIFHREQDGHWSLVGTWLAGIGASSTPTYLGVYKTFDRQDYFSKNGSLWMNATFWNGGIAFHSTSYNPDTGKYDNSASQLGKTISHGCVRLEPELAEWIHSLPLGITVCVDDRIWSPSSISTGAPALNP